jgi:hypothetical protein
MCYKDARNDFEITYKKGKHNVVENDLSRKEEET